MYRAIGNLNIPPPPGKPPGICTFSFWVAQIPLPWGRKAIQIPHHWSQRVNQMPQPSGQVLLLLTLCRNIFNVKSETLYTGKFLRPSLVSHFHHPSNPVQIPHLETVTGVNFPAAGAWELIKFPGYAGGGGVVVLNLIDTLHVWQQKSL